LVSKLSPHNTTVKLQVQNADNDENPKEQLKSIQAIRHLLCINNKPYHEDVLNSGVLPILIRCLSRHDNHDLQFEATWTLTNLACGNTQETRRIVDAGVIPCLLRLLKSPSLKVAEQSIWTFGNIICDGPDLRDCAIKSGIVPALLHLIRPDAPWPILRMVTWVLSSLCAHKKNSTQISVSTASEILPAFRILVHHKDEQISVEAANGLRHLTWSGPEMIQLLIDSRTIPILVKVLSHSNFDVRKFALDSLNHIASISDDHKQMLLNCNVLSFIQQLVCSSDDEIRKKATIFLFNITAGGESLIQAVYDIGLVPSIIENFKHPTVRKVTVSTIFNITRKGNTTQIQQLVFEGVIEALCKSLDGQEMETTSMILHSLENILNKVNDRRPLVKKTVKDSGILDEIRKLRAYFDLSYPFTSFDNLVNELLEELGESLDSGNQIYSIF
jgi:hypothetical protein